jgi:hypothetical protein
MLKTVNFENVNFNEKFSYKGRTYKKVVCANDEPGAFNLFDESICTSCQDWDCLVDRKEGCAVEPPKERKEGCAVEPPKERKKYLFRDEDYGAVYGLLLTDEQIAFCKWLDEHSYLRELTWERADGLEFTKI